LMANISATPETKTPSEYNGLLSKTRRFAPTVLTANTTHLSPGDRKALKKIIEAAKLLDPLFLSQVWSGNDELFKKLSADKTPIGRARLHYFLINDGPWSRLDNNEPFIDGVPKEKPSQANFYTDDITKDEFNSWLAGLPGSDKENATGYFYVIRRDASGKLMSVPYNGEYREFLEPAARLLREAAALTTNATLKDFLSKRADAFASNDYYASDVAWMDLDAPLDITIGPYETYNDEMFGYKASYEAYITLRDDAETGKVQFFANHLQEIENNLPIEPIYRNPKIGASSPIRVVNQILAAGDGAHGVKTAAFNLPNDERVIEQKGSKRVMLKNVQEAKFEHVLLPIAHRVLAKSSQPDVKFEPFFTHILTHELMHGLGPHQIQVQGRNTTPREEMKELYSAIEEAKADVTGLWALQYMMDHAKEMSLEKLLSAGAAAERQLYTTFLASSFRTLRFGLHEAHGRGMAIQVNYLMGRGGFVANADGIFSVNLEKAKTAVQDLDRELLTMEAEGNYAAAKKMLDAAATLRPEFLKALEKLKDVPTDIAPRFVTAEKLAPPESQPAKSTKK